jgi:hypothetical protein
MTTSAINISWAAGLFEGEGCITHSNPGRPRLVLTMTDEDVVNKFAGIVGGKVVPHKMGPVISANKKPAWTWRTGRRSEIIKILSMFLPFLGNRRAYKALNALDDIELN